MGVVAIAAAGWLAAAEAGRTTAAAIHALPSAAAHIEDDSELVDPRAGGDHHRMPGSACIDAGTTRAAPMDDLEGDPRPAGTAHDIGPDEAG